MSFPTRLRCSNHSEKEKERNGTENQHYPGRDKKASRISTLAARPLIWLVKMYKLLISPFIGQCCRFYPSCSSYAIEALEKHGLFRGAWFTIKRILRCHPLCEGGVDPVPDRKIGKSGCCKSNIRICEEKGQ